MNRLLCSFIFLHVVFIMGCSDNIVYNNSSVKTSTNRASHSDKSMYEVESQIYTGINKIRNAHHLAKLSRDSGLDKVAQEYSKAMAKEGVISHVDSSGKSMEDRLEDVGIIDWSQAGENLASSTVGAEPAQSALWGWQQSPGHLENILLPTFVYTGIGAYRDSNTGEVFITQLFLTP